MTKVRVTYWRGTTECEGVATSYRGAMRIASRNQNAWEPRFYDAETGERLYDDGQGLANPDRDEEIKLESCTTVRRCYVV
jgi:hypothetical protein